MILTWKKSDWNDCKMIVIEILLLKICLMLK